MAGLAHALTGLWLAAQPLAVYWAAYLVSPLWAAVFALFGSVVGLALMLRIRLLDRQNDDLMWAYLRSQERLYGKAAQADAGRGTGWERLL